MKARSPFQRMNRRREDGYRVVKNEATKEAEVFLYEEIGFWGVNAKQFADDIKAIDAEVINLHINSPGGSVFDGTTIFNLLRQHDAKVVSHIDGLAASIASIIALAGDEVRMAKNAFMMIHDPWTVSMGDSNQLRKDAQLLDKIGGMLVQTYAGVTHKEDQIIRDWMRAETWFNADEALAAGLVTSVVEATDVNASVFDLSVFAHVPKEVLDTAGIAACEKPTVRDVERVLRDAGYSRSEAVAASSSFVDQRDTGTKELKKDLGEFISEMKSPPKRN